MGIMHQHQSMFTSCVNIDDNASETSRSLPRDDELMDQLLDESIRLKRKNSQLRELVQSLEDKFNKDREAYEEELERREMKHLGIISELESRYYIDKMTLKDSFKQEVESVRVLLRETNSRYQQYEQDIEKHRKECQENVERLQILEQEVRVLLSSIVDIIVLEYRKNN